MPLDLTPSPGGSSGPADDETAAAVALENHPNAVKLARSDMVWALPWLALGIAGASSSATRLGSGGFLACLALIVWSGGRVVRYVRVLREDPVTLWRRENREHLERQARAADFRERVETITPWATIALISLIIAVTLIEFLTGGVRHAIRVAALVKPAVNAGEWWRVLTAAYLHGSLAHLAANMVSLWWLGRVVEIYDRRSRIPLVFLTSALGCSLASIALVQASSLGASGGVIGLAGYLLVTAGTTPGVAPSWVRKQMLVVLANVVITGIAGYRYIDNAGHAGGIIAGALTGLYVRHAVDRHRESALEIVSWIATAIVVAGATFTVLRLLG